MDEEIVRRRDLPHWDVPGAAYFVTTCLHGSLPAQGLLDVAQFRAELRNHPRPRDVTAADWRTRQWKREFARLDRWLDLQPACRVLEDARLAQAVVNAMLFFAGERYDLFAFAVMPSHFHWLFQPRSKWVDALPADRRTPRERITYSINRFTAKTCNALLNAQGTFWQRESYDHWVRDVEELERIIRYIEENPVKAGMVQSPEQWLFSSAKLRQLAGLEWGMPLTKGLARLES
jgi:type I restriction enzyme R subunit